MNKKKKKKMREWNNNKKKVQVLFISTSILERQCSVNNNLLHIHLISSMTGHNNESVFSHYNY